MRQVGKTEQDIKRSNLVRGRLNTLTLRSDLPPDFLEKVIFDLNHPVFRTEDLLLVLFECRRNIALGVGQGLLALIVIRHPAEM